MSVVRRPALVLALVAAVGVLVASALAVAVPALRAGSGVGVTGPGAARTGNGGTGMGAGGTGTGMGMGTARGAGMGLWLAGDGTRVGSIAAARSRAALAAGGYGLRTGEVIWFDNGFYVELKDAAGQPATEVVVDPAGGAVRTEPGPAMMWNTRYGMRAGPGTARISPARARRIATAWVAAHRPGRLVGEPDTYPGYDTMETTTPDGTINGMLSVNTATGQVWWHSWHGRFLAREDA